MAASCRECGAAKPPGRGRQLCDGCRSTAADRARQKQQAIGRRHYQRNREQYIDRATQRAQSDPEGTAAYQRAYHEKRKADGTVLHLRVAKYGLTADDFHRLLEAQGGVCAICGGNDQQRRINVDHDHETGEVRGLLCSGCNGAKLGRLGDDPERAEARATFHEQRARSLRAAAAYLRNPPARGVLGGEQP